MALDRKIREGLDRADRLMEGLLVLGRAEHGELGDQAPVALPEIIDAALAELRRTSPPSGSRSNAPSSRYRFPVIQR